MHVVRWSLLFVYSERFISSIKCKKVKTFGCMQVRISQSIVVSVLSFPPRIDTSLQVCECKTLGVKLKKVP